MKPEPSAIEPTLLSPWRWWMAVPVMLATVVNYVDRLTISILAPVIQADLGLTNLQYAGVATWFLLLYAIGMPLYLYHVRGFTLQKIGLLAWIPYFAAALGSLAGGGLSSALITRGWSRHKARRTAILIATALLPLGGLAPLIPTAEGALALISVILFAFQFWVNNVQTIPSDLYPSASVGIIAGLSGGGAALGAMTMMLTTGWVVDHFSYTPILILASALGPLATTALLVLIGRPAAD